MNSESTLLTAVKLSPAQLAELFVDTAIRLIPYLPISHEERRPSGIDEDKLRQVENVAFNVALFLENSHCRNSKLSQQLRNIGEIRSMQLRAKSERQPPSEQPI